MTGVQNTMETEGLPIQDIKAEATGPTEKPKDNKTLAAEAMRESWRTPPKNPFAKEPDEHEDIRKAHEVAIETALAEGATREEIKELAQVQEKEAAQKAYMELTKLHISTGGFPLGRTTKEQYAQRTEPNAAIDQAVRFGVSRDEIEEPGLQYLQEVRENEQAEALHAAQEAHLALTKLHIETGGFPLNATTDEQYALRAKYEEIIRGAKRKGVATEDIEQQGNQYLREVRDRQRKGIVESARAAKDELTVLHRETKGFPIGGTTDEQYAKRAELEEKIRQARFRWDVTDEELGITRPKQQ